VKENDGYTNLIKYILLVEGNLPEFNFSLYNEMFGPAEIRK